MNADHTETELDRLLLQAEDLAGKATPGPWRELDTPQDTPRYMGAGETNLFMGGILHSCDAAFIAWCRTGVPQLVAAIKELKVRYDQHIKALDEACVENDALRGRIARVEEIASDLECEEGNEAFEAGDQTPRGRDLIAIANKLRAALKESQ